MSHRKEQGTTGTDAQPGTQQQASGETPEQVAQPAGDEVSTSLVEDCEKYRNNWIRAEAELENLRKRHAREKDELRRYALDDIIRAIVTPVDYLEMAVAHAKTSPSIEAVIQGVEFTHKSLIDILRGFGVECVSAEGRPFDPATHEAQAVEETDAAPEGTVLKEHRKAYLLNGRLLRAGIATVAKAPAPPAAESDTQSEHS